MTNTREGGNVLAGGCQENGCQALQWNVSLNRLRAALEDAATALADASEALDMLGMQVDASDAHQAHRAVREALEGPFADGPQTDANTAKEGPADA